jgi:aspartyl protease family protein
MPRSKLRKNLLILALGAAAAAEAWAQNLFVTNIAGNQAQVIVNGTVLRSLRVGDTSPEGVRLLEVRGTVAVFEVGGRPMALGLGQSTVLQTTLQADASGHFVAQALINGVAVPAVIDTGASHVTLNMAHAARMGIDLRGARRAISYTANGPTATYVVPLASVQVGDIVLRNVIGEVIEGGAQTLPIALIGMSFLKHVEMRRSGAVMTLSRPHLQ